MSHGPDFGFQPSPWEREKRRSEMRTEIEDFFIGAVFGLVTYFALGLGCLMVAIVCGVLWEAGGQGYLETKAWRRLGVPFCICLPFSLTGHVFGAVISFVLQCAWQTVGYGIPDVNDPKGSWLGRLCGKWTRVVWYAILTVAMIPLFIK